MKAIETVYKGYRFRSRLEARWAVFFDALGIKWEYELQGYEMSDGTRYLPDFYLPSFCGGMYAEVKPHGGDFSKAVKLVEESHMPVWCCEGTPDYRVYEILEWYEDHVDIGIGCPNISEARTEDRMFWEPGFENPDGTIPIDCQEPHYQQAIAAARQARFSA